MGRSFWLWFGGIWALAGITLLLIGVGMFLGDQTFASTGRTATGIVLTKEIVPADSDSSTRYRVRYRFTSDAGQDVEGSDEVSLEAWERLTERGPVAVRYLSADPGRNRLDDGADAVIALIFMVGGAVFGGIGTILVLRSLRRLRRERRLLRTGVPATATVTGVEETNVSFNRRQQFRVRYRFESPDGRIHEGRSGYLDWSVATAWTEGTQASVRYDPAQPGDSLWVGALEPDPAPFDIPPPASSRPG